MKAVKFPQANLELAKDQPQYQMIPVYVETKSVLVTDPDHPEKAAELKDVPWQMTACFELTIEEMAELNHTGKLWFTQMVMGQKFQPVMMSTQNPFK